MEESFQEENWDYFCYRSPCDRLLAASLLQSTTRVEVTADKFIRQWTPKVIAKQLGLLSTDNDKWTDEAESFITSMERSRGRYRHRVERSLIMIGESSYTDKSETDLGLEKADKKYGLQIPCGQLSSTSQGQDANWIKPNKVAANKTVTLKKR